MEIIEFIPSSILWKICVFLLALTLIALVKVQNSNIDATKSLNSSTNSINRSNPVKILYLRGFLVDGLPINIISIPLGMGSRKVRALDYEAYLAKKFYNIGHFIALDARNGIETIGADRIVIDNQNTMWKGEVLKQMKAASMIILRPAFSKGLIWEIEQIVKYKYLYKVVICIAPSEYNKKLYNDFKNKFKELLPELPDFRSSYSYISFNRKGEVVLTDEIEEVLQFKILNNLTNNFLDFEIDKNLFQDMDSYLRYKFQKQRYKTYNKPSINKSTSLLKYFYLFLAGSVILYLNGFLYETLILAFISLFILLGSLISKKRS